MNKKPQNKYFDHGVQGNGKDNLLGSAETKFQDEVLNTDVENVYSQNSNSILQHQIKSVGGHNGCCDSLNNNLFESMHEEEQISFYNHKVRPSFYTIS